VLRGKGLEKSADIVSLGPHAAHDEVPRRPIERDAPGAQVMVIHLIVGNVVDLRMLGDELFVERINGRMGLHN
jgi:hypothetical protein